jgi:probable F420-dependent oxidoreductase
VDVEVDPMTDDGMPTGDADLFTGVSPATQQLGRLGVWSNLDHLTGLEVRTFASRVESLGVDALWIQEGAGREPFATLGALVTATSRIALGVGIASIYARDAAASHAGALTLAELSGGRFVLGLGVSHAWRVEGQRGHTYLPPLGAMRAYLDAYDQAPFQAQHPAVEPPLVIAALRRRMLELAASRTDGAFPYLVPADYVARARATIDSAAAAAGRTDRPALVVALPAIAETDATAARTIARRFMEPYLGMPNYLRNLAECGFAEQEVRVPGSDRLVDAIVGWGSGAELRSRIDRLHAAGADHVAIIPLASDARHGHLPVVDAILR